MALNRWVMQEAPLRTASSPVWRSAAEWPKETTIPWSANILTASRAPGSSGASVIMDTWLRSPPYVCFTSSKPPANDRKRENKDLLWRGGKRLSSLNLRNQSASRSDDLFVKASQGSQIHKLTRQYIYDKLGVWRAEPLVKPSNNKLHHTERQRMTTTSVIFRKDQQALYSYKLSEKIESKIQDFFKFWRNEFFHFFDWTFWESWGKLGTDWDYEWNLQD